MGKALLVIDMLNDFVEEKGSLYVGEGARKVIPFIKQKIEEFRKEACPVVFVCDSHEKDDREFEMFPPHCISGSWGSEVIKELELKKEDKIVKKRRYSAFYGTDLDLYLRALYR